MQPETRPLDALIAAVRRRWFMTIALRTGGRAMAAAAAPLLAAAGVYWLFSPSGAGLLILAGAGTLLAAAAGWLTCRRVQPRPDDVRVARFIEERAGTRPAFAPMDDVVVSAVRLASAGREEARTLFAPLIIAGALRRLEGIDATGIVPFADIRRSGAIAAAGGALLALGMVLGVPVLRHASESARLVFFPGSIAVEVLPGDVRIPAGQPLTITARLSAGDGALDRSRPQLIVSAGADERTVEMTAGAEGFGFSFESVDRTFRYKVVAGAAASREYTVTALFAPRVSRIDLHYRYPAFTKLAPRDEEDGGDIYAPEGTRVRVRVHTDKPVASGQLGLSTGNPPLRSSGDNVLEAEVVVARDDSYRIRLMDRDGLASDGDTEYFIRMMEDRPPDVRILRPSGDQGITPLQEVAIEARAEDDYGIASLDLVYAVGGGVERVIPFPKQAGATTVRTGAYLLAAEELKVRPGDVITYYAKTRDVARGRRSTATTSDIFFLEVTPFNEEFVEAQSQAGAGAGDPQIESLIEAQKEIISATWNIERRAAGGRSAADVQAIAKAQADLKARAERMLGGSRGGRGFVPQRTLTQPTQPRGPTTGESMATAVGAMGRAVDQLGTQRTREAISHEVSALNSLLQAQAEVRRRQVTQQARGGGSGSNRQSQDLSALFDKELQRQQRTNYEQRSQTEERQDSQGSNQESLDRIRDLARRQEDLNRRQQEQATATADERKRQLETLAREQQELQRQTEALAREMAPQGRQQDQRENPRQGQQQGAQQGQQQGRSGQQTGAQTQGGAGLRQAAEQMKDAVGGMTRQDGESAAQSGRRAAEQLRALEQQMRGGADARQRAVADLQTEARQIAQEQQRIAAEAQRMEKSGEAGAPDARRRLAADKDRLSDRVDSLEREAQRLGDERAPSGRSGRAAGSGTAPGDEQTRARWAAGELEQQQIAERMRQSAAQLRGGRPASGEAEQQLARTLDRVVEKLGGSVSEEARTLAAQLDRSNGIRERLDKLEAQLREAERRQDGSVEKLRHDYRQELGRARAALGTQASPEKPGGARGSTPEEQVFSGSAPGTEAFKQDRSSWQSLRKDLDRALEEHDASVSRRLVRAVGEHGLNAGGSSRIPEQYRRLVARYYESLARVSK